jgi:plasmid maintenance system antidote protein VapI
MAEIGVDASTIEKILKGMEHLTIVMVRKIEDRSSSFKYRD